MRLLSRIALGGVLAAALAASSATLVALDPVAPQAQAQPRALTTFDSCPALLDWYVDQALGDVGAFGWNDGFRGGPWMDARMLSAQRAAEVVPTSGSAFTGTNTQEAAVDEPDIAKTNGTLLARVVDDTTLVLIDVTGAQPRTTARLRLPSYGYQSELLLAGDHLLITQQVWSEPGTSTSARAGRYLDGFRPGRAITRVVDVDIADPTAPRLLSRDRYSGRLLSARQYGDTVRVVTATERPALTWTYPGQGVSRREAVRRNKALVRRTTIADWLPSVMRNGSPGTLLNCDQVLHPARPAGTDTVVVTTFPTGSSGERTALGITAGGGIVYSSTDRLYLATSDYPERGGATAIHAFDLTGPTTYLGSGRVEGRLRDRWSLDEHGGHLRAAWTRTSRKGRTSNGITVLTERDGKLVTTASVAHLGIDEDLQSVRWFDDLAVLVTYRRTDPLYTVDLTDPDHPLVLGALKIPGYSGYLHPIGDHLLLGLGMAGDAEGNTTGAQAAVFDISNPRTPVRTSQRSLGRDTYLPAVDDPHAFTWAEAGRTAVTPLSDWRTGTARMIGLHVDAAGKLGTTSYGALRTERQARSFALPDGRIAVLDQHRVRLISL